MLSLVERFICATFSYALFRILTSPLSNLLKTAFAKSHAEGLAVTSFASICLRTQPLLSCARSDTLFFFVFFLNHLGKQNARRLKRCVSYDWQVFHQLLFRPIQMCKTFNDVPTLTHMSKQNQFNTNE